MKSFLLTTLFLASTLSFAQETKTTSQDSIPKIEKNNDLKEVTIYGNKKQFLKIESDKTIVSVKDNPMLSTGNAYEAVRKLPGVITSPVGGLSLNGKGVAIYIDGSPSTLSGADLQNYLSSLPANAIEKVELVYNPGAAYDANSSGSVINIITATRRLKGINASFNINYNFNKYQKPSPQILLNGKEKSFSWQTMLGYNYIDSDQKSVNGQTFNYFTPNKFLEQSRLNVNTNRNLYFRVGTNFKLSKMSNLLFNYNGNWSNDRDVFDAQTLGTGNINYLNNGTTKTKDKNNDISLQYKTKLDTLGRTLNITAYANRFDKHPTSLTNANDGTENSYNNSSIDLKLKNYYLKYDFEFPFEKLKFSVNTGGKFNILEVTNNGRYFSGISNTSSSFNRKIDFDYSENNLAFYVEARKKIKKFNFTAGLRFEDFNVERIASTSSEKIKFRNTNLFPNVSANYEVAESITVTGSYNRKINQPSYGNLDPNNSSFDQYSVAQGNLFLKPTFYDNYELKLNAFQFIELGTNLTVAKDNNLFIFNADDNEFVSKQTFQQFDKFKTLSAYFSFPIPLDYFLKDKEEFNKRMANMDEMNYIFCNISYIKSITDGYTFAFEAKPVWNFYTQAQIMLPWKIKSSWTYYVLPAGGNWEIYRVTKPIQQFDMSFNRDFMNKKLKIGIHAFDIFNVNEINALVSSTNLQTNFYQKQDSRTFRISLTYNFGNLKLETENTKIETDKLKTGGGLVK